MTDAMTQSLQARENMYRLLSRFYHKEIDSVFLNILQELVLNSETRNTSFDNGVKELQSAAQTLTENDLDELAADYARVFLGACVAGGTTAFPIESIYTSPNKLVVQDAFEDVYRTFSKAGFAKTETNLFEDRLALELSYMAELCRQGREAIAENNAQTLDQVLEAQADFF